MIPNLRRIINRRIPPFDHKFDAEYGNYAGGQLMYHKIRGE